MFRILNPRNKNDQGIIFDDNGQVYKQGYKRSSNYVKSNWNKQQKEIFNAVLKHNEECYSNIETNNF